jgi:hypothetical protein
LLRGGTILDGVLPYLKDASIPVTRGQGRFLCRRNRRHASTSVADAPPDHGTGTIRADGPVHVVEELL